MSSPDSSEAFNPYYVWLGIPPEDHADYYRLLGIRRFESNHDVIHNAFNLRMTFLRTKQTGNYAQYSQQLQNEIITAQRVLLHDEQRTAYNVQLQASEQAVCTDTPSLSVETVVTQPAVTARTQRNKQPAVSMALLQLLGVVVGGLFAIPCAIGLFAMLGMDPFGLLTKKTKQLTHLLRQRNRTGSKEAVLPATSSNERYRRSSLRTMIPYRKMHNSR
jgi:hypothetical protein